ncbi:MAG: glycosyltransferase [Odoribacteraceae bacterium]|nr:glycosyltransferase [Odoribacteraceae bacterium]
MVYTDIFVFPSYREVFPNVVLQAGAMGLPAIVPAINGCNEMITGLIIPPKDKRALQEKMGLLLVDNDLRARLHRDARAMIASRYEQRGGLADRRGGGAGRGDRESACRWWPMREGSAVIGANYIPSRAAFFLATRPVGRKIFRPYL